MATLSSSAHKQTSKQASKEVQFGEQVRPHAVVVFKRLSERQPEVTTICSNFKFAGQGAHETPVADAKTQCETKQQYTQTTPTNKQQTNEQTRNKTDKRATKHKGTKNASVELGRLRAQYPEVFAKELERVRDLYGDSLTNCYSVRFRDSHGRIGANTTPVATLQGEHRNQSTLTLNNTSQHNAQASNKTTTPHGANYQTSKQADEQARQRSIKQNT